MNRKQFTLLMILVVAVGGLSLYLSSKRQADWQGAASDAGQKLLGDFQLNDVAEIHIASLTNDLTVYKKGDLWRVKERQDYPANFSTVGDTLRKISDLKVVQNEKIGPSHHARLELIKPPGQGTNSGTLVEFKDKGGKVVRSVLLGKKYVKKQESSSPFGGDGWPAGRYVLNLQNPDSVALVSDSLASVEPKPTDWLDKEFFKIEKPKSIAFVSTVASNSWTVSRETESGEWKLADARGDEKLDSGKASGVTSPFSYPSFTDVLTAGAKPEETGLDNPNVLKVQTFDGFAYTVKVGGKTNEDNLPITLTVEATLSGERTPGKDEKPEDKDKLDKEFKEKAKQLQEKLQNEKKFENHIYLVSKWTVESLMKERSQLLAEKKEEPKKEEKPPAPAELKPEAKPPAADVKPEAKPDSKLEKKSDAVPPAPKP
jgi:hypothetical protein